jgi:hypothetical protein
VGAGTNGGSKAREVTMQVLGERQGPAVLRFFGLETPAKAVRTILWALPYVLALGMGLAGISWFSNRLLRMPIWVYAIAIGLALLYAFLFLARLHEIEAGAPRGGEPPTES